MGRVRFFEPAKLGGKERDMPTYVFHLHDGPDVPPMREEVQAMSDDESRNLAELRISLSHTFTHVRVERDGAEVFRIQRDSVDDLT